MINPDIEFEYIYIYRLFCAHNTSTGSFLEIQLWTMLMKRIFRHFNLILYQRTLNLATMPICPQWRSIVDWFELQLWLFTGIWNICFFRWMKKKTMSCGLNSRYESIHTYNERIFHTHESCGSFTAAWSPKTVHSRTLQRLHVTFTKSFCRNITHTNITYEQWTVNRDFPRSDFMCVCVCLYSVFMRDMRAFAEWYYSWIVDCND